MKKLFILTIALSLASAATASAQTTVRLGVRGGVNFAATTLASSSSFGNQNPTDNFSGTKAGLYAGQGGLVVEIAFGKLALQPGLLISQKGEQFDTHFATSAYGGAVIDQTSTNRYNWLELPINVVYTLHGDHGLQVFAGPYVGVGIDGTQQGEAISTSGQSPGPHTSSFNNPVDYGTNTYNKRLDMGFNLGIGYRLGPVQVQAGYGLGLVDLHSMFDHSRLGYGLHNFANDAAYNRVAQLTATYFFKL